MRTTQPQRPTPLPGGYGYNGQAVNVGSNMERHDRESGGNAPTGTPDAQRGVTDLRNSLQDTAASGLRRDMETQNAQQAMDEYGMQSDLSRQRTSLQSRLSQMASGRKSKENDLAYGLYDAIARQRAMLYESLTRQA